MPRIQTDNYYSRGGYGIKAVVLHITEGSSSSAISWFKNPESNASAHYLVAEYGEVYQLVDEEFAAWHTGKVVRPTWDGLIEGVNPNYYTIGVELALLNDRSMPTWRQWIAWARLVKDIKRRNFNIDIVNHNEIRADKTCPGFWGSRFYYNILKNFV